MKVKKSSLSPGTIGDRRHCRHHHVKCHQRRRDLQDRAFARQHQLSDMEILDEDGITSKRSLGGGEW